MKNCRFFFLLILFSCSSSKNIKENKLYPINYENHLENIKALITEKENHYIYETNDLSLMLPYNWRSYLEPTAGEQVRHSPFKNNKVESDVNLYLTIIKTNEKVKKIADRFRIRLKMNLRLDYRELSTILKSEGKDSIGYYYKIVFFHTINKVRFKRIVSFYDLEGDKYLFLRKVYPIDSTILKQREIDTILRTLVIK
tara:strand:+ start:2519 stop:3112 length:594 start_codon:yes stop_codon:yes gene_type:complete